MADMTVLVKPQVVMGPRGRLVEKRACIYCWGTFTQSRTDQVCCSSECSKRNSAWNTWVRETRTAAVYGQKGAALPPAGRTLFDAIAGSEVSTELEAVA